MPGWAVTIHRAQGRTLEKVFVDLSQGAFASGQAYVAISRVTRLEGLLLRTRPRMRDFFVHERVSAFLDYIGSDEADGRRSAIRTDDFRGYPSDKQYL